MGQTSKRVQTRVTAGLYRVILDLSGVVVGQSGVIVGLSEVREGQTVNSQFCMIQ